MHVSISVNLCQIDTALLNILGILGIKAGGAWLVVRVLLYDTWLLRVEINGQLAIGDVCVIKDKSHEVICLVISSRVQAGISG